MKFTKMHGIGNDYVFVDCFHERVTNPAKVAIAISDRHFGVGSDGLILICPSKKADARMRIFNADGSEAEMCGNGIRCVAKYVYEHKLAKPAGPVAMGNGTKYPPSAWPCAAKLCRRSASIWANQNSGQKKFPSITPAKE
jgi:diaminopimelate epimerase